eukprot:TRINITY_DN7755_c0_g1_i1.p1 TRINITY_DN7755_c0_g1~~TRINITY_DN7755_c0_g1_i1.p1  ORF type:complete len:289 (+),score=66.17 TRINITY_DN7755_c0_g1_i1:79-945(+)
MPPPRVVLCTDLDGTFLGDPDRERLYNAIRTHRSQVLLIYATGRSLPDVRNRLGWNAKTSTYSGPTVPIPDYLICDVGTTVFDGSPPHAPVAGTQQWIRDSWGEAGRRVRDLLAGEAGLELQGGGAGWEAIEEDGTATSAAHPRERGDMCRVSYYYTAECALERVRAKVEGAGLQFIASHGRFIDVLPGGVGKGTTLLRLLRDRGVDPRLSVVAGDTCNDLSLFQVCTAEGPRGVVVGNAEQALRDALKHPSAAPGIYFAKANGAAGVWEGLVTVFGHSWLAQPAPSL